MGSGLGRSSLASSPVSLTTPSSTTGLEAGCWGWGCGGGGGKDAGLEAGCWGAWGSGGGGLVRAGTSGPVGA